MNNKALSTVLKHNLISNNDKIIVAVSGGADSMALILFLLEIKEAFNLSLYVCHVNHGFRGEESDSDEKFVEAFCKAHSLPFYSARFDVNALSKERSIGFEECGREIRYAFFNETAEKIGENVKIATAHTLNDNMESVILNFTRGSAQSGLSGIDIKRDNIIRPLLMCKRSEIEAYLKLKNQDFVTDKTNFDTSYTRNFVRHQIVPMLNKLNPSFDESIKNLTDIMREQQDFFKTEAKRFLKDFNDGINRNDFLALHKALRKEVLKEYLYFYDIEINKERIFKIDELIEKGDFKLSLKKDGYLILKDNKINFEILKDVSAPKFENELEISLGNINFNDRILNFSLISREEFENIKKNSKILLKNCLDYDIIKGSVLRARRDGDYISLFPRNVTKTLKKLLNEVKTTAEKRYIIPLIAKESHILWVDGIGVDSSARVTKDTQNILFISAQKQTES